MSPPLARSALRVVTYNVRYFGHATRGLASTSAAFGRIARALVSLDPLTRFEKPLSWRVRAFAMRPRDRACPDCLEQGLEGGVGATLASDSQRVALFVMADAYVLGSSGLHGIGGSFVRAGVGPYGGVRLHLPGHTVALVTGGWSYLPGSSLVGTYDLGATVRCELGRDVALGAEARVQPLSTEALLTSYFYF